MGERDMDLEEIEGLIMAHFEPMSWSADKRPDWDRFLADFLPDAMLFPAARPAEGRTVEEFVERMTAVADKLHTFEEHTKKVSIQRFGNIAIALGLSWMLENGDEENRDVSAYLLVKSKGRWHIAAQAWHPLHEDEMPPEPLQ